MPVPSLSGQCLALTTASPAPARLGAWARAGSGTSWMCCPGRGPVWAWRSCRGQVRPPGWWAQRTPVEEHPRDLPEVPRGGLGVPGEPQLCPWDWQQFLLAALQCQFLCWHPSRTTSMAGCLLVRETLSSPGCCRESEGQYGWLARSAQVWEEMEGTQGVVAQLATQALSHQGAEEDGVGLWEPRDLGPRHGRCLTLSLVLRRAGVLGQGPVHLCLPSQGAPDVRVPVPLRVLPGRAQLCLPAGWR